MTLHVALDVCALRLHFECFLARIRQPHSRESRCDSLRSLCRRHERVREGNDSTPKLISRHRLLAFVIDLELLVFDVISNSLIPSHRNLSRLTLCRYARGSLLTRRDYGAS